MLSALRSLPNKRVAFLGFVVVALAVAFWSGSRYPQLDEKAFMGGDIKLEDPLSFDAVVQLQTGDPLAKRIAYSTINWLHTNKQGMTFGVLLGATFLTLLRLFRRRSYVSGFGNTLLGVVMGAPLGVCVNCAAPVAKGLHHAGARIETTLAAMVSSPTLNVVVLTMLFAIFPPFIAVTKMAFTLLFILVAIPLMARYLFRAELAESVEAAACALPETVAIRPNETWLEAALGAARDLLGNLWFIVRTTVPLMFLAGLLGAALIHLVPLATLSTVGSGAITMTLIAAAGLFLPVPMAFDVVICAALLAAGMPILYVTILLFTLGIYSVYSYFIVANTISKRVAFGMFVVLGAMGLLAGTTADAYNKWELRRMMDFIDEELGAPGAGERDGAALQGVSGIIGGALAAVETTPGSPDIAVRRIDYQPRSPAAEKPFTRLEGPALGLDKPNRFSVQDFWGPFFHGYGLASGDVNNDGWVDVVSGSEAGVLLYINREGKSFDSNEIDVPAARDLNVLVVALVDINNDGWLDIYFATYREGNYYILNDHGRFTGKNFIKASNKGAVLAHAVAFGDIDRDGDLDAVLGNWFFGIPKEIPPIQSQNKVQINEKGIFREENLDGVTGETLSVLLSDFNGDGQLDLLVGNDFVQPDVFYLGDGSGAFREIVREDGAIPVTTWFTMSIDTADINNDLRMDLYIVGIAAGGTGKGAQIKVREAREYCTDVVDPTHKAACARNIETRKFYHFAKTHQPSDVRQCRRISNEAERQACMAMMLMKTAIRERNKDICQHIERIPGNQERATFLCNGFFEQGIYTTEEEYTRAVPQVFNRNVLLVGSEGGKFVDKAEEMNVDITGWGWNGKIADLDNDEWQDIYVVNGTWLQTEKVPSNLYFSNRKGQGFVDKTDEFGLDDYMIVSAYTYVDFDNDGDLDIITNSVNGPLKAFVNNEPSNNSISVDLRDHRGNRFGIGSKVIIHYGGASRRQVREIKAGGGYMSYDPPVAHFGLGAFEEVNRMEIIWSTGERTEIEGPFHSRALYRIERR